MARDDETATEQPAPRKATGRPFQPGHSGNPRGRPKAGFALTTLIRERVGAENIVTMALKAARDGTPRDQIAAATMLASFGWMRPEQRHEFVVGSSESDEDLSACTLAELEELDQLERRRAQILEAAAARVALPGGEP